MVKKYRDLTEKYKTLRLQPDPYYQSRTVQTLFNKFTKKGKKTAARKQILRALKQFRYSLSRPRTYNTLLRIMHSLQVPFALLAKREAKQMVEVPVPVRRNKRDIVSIQTLYKAIQKRTERALYERIEQELLSLTLFSENSATLRQRSQFLYKVYEERTNLEKRWK